MHGSSWLIFVGCAFAAEVIGTMAGFGAATVLTPIASLFLDIKTAVAVVACFHLFGNASRIAFFRRHLRWPVILSFGGTGVVCAFLGAFASSWLPAPAIRIALGGFLVFYAMAEALRWTALRLPATRPTLVAGGVLSGFIAGLIGTGGAVRSVCLLAFGLPREAYIGTSAVIALAVDATRVPVYVAQRVLPASVVPVILSLTVAAFGGAWLGQRLVRIVSPARFKQFVLLMLLIMGGKLLFDGWNGLG